ncbi:hypothetical protein Tco_1153263 [Tanacetum coccineum]
MTIQQDRPTTITILAPTSSPPLLLPSTNRREDKLEVTLLPRKRLGIALGPRRDPERYVGYGITDTWDEMLEDMPAEPATNDTELGRQMTEFATRVRQDTDEIYTRLDDEQTERQLMAGRLNMLYRDKRGVHMLVQKGMPLRTTVLGSACSDYRLQAADRMRHAYYRKMAPKRPTRRSKHSPRNNNTTSITNAQLQAMIDQGVTVALAARNANISMNDDDSHNLGMGVRRKERAARECTYTDFLKCQPLNFKGTEGVSVALTWWNTHVKIVGHDAAYETGNGNLGYEGEGYRLDKLYPTLSGIGFVVWEDVS